jgi:predicted lipid-binding transport protein (Tim44 family)
MPKQGAMKGIQYLNITKSGFFLQISFPILIQLIGLIELITACINKFFGAGSLENCDLPGNSNDGY